MIVVATITFHALSDGHRLAGLAFPLAVWPSGHA